MNPELQAILNFAQSLGEGGGIPLLSKKDAGTVTDWDFQMANGLVDPRALQSITTMDPYFSEGDAMVSLYAQSTDPLQQSIATAVLEHGARTLPEITRLIAENAGLTVDDEAFAPQISGIEQAAKPLIDAIMQDALKLESGELVRHTDGQLYTTSTEEHPMVEHARNSGYLNDPTAEFSPYILFEEGREEEDLAAISRAEAAERELEQARAAYRNFAATEENMGNQSFMQEESETQNPDFDDLIAMAQSQQPDFYSSGQSLSGGSSVQPVGDRGYTETEAAAINRALDPTNGIGWHPDTGIARDDWAEARERFAADGITNVEATAGLGRLTGQGSGLRNMAAAAQDAGHGRMISSPRARPSSPIRKAAQRRANATAADERASWIANVNAEALEKARRQVTEGLTAKGYTPFNLEVMGRNAAGGFYG